MPHFPVFHHLPSLLKLMSIETMMPSNSLILCCHLLLLPSIFPSIRVFSNVSALWIMWPKYWNFRINLSNKYSGLISFSIDQLDLAVQGLLRVFSSTRIRKHQFFGTQSSLWSNCHICIRLLKKPSCCAKSLQSCPLLCDPMDCSPPGSSVHRLLQASILEWVAMPSSRGSSQPRDCTRFSYVSCIGRQDFWTRVSLGKISSYRPLPPAIYLTFNSPVLRGGPEPLSPNCIKWLVFTYHGKLGVEPGLELSSHNRCTPAPSLIHHSLLSSL